MKKIYYLLGVESGVEPTVYGPYATIDEQGNAAKQIHQKQEEVDHLFWAEVDEAGMLTVGAYGAGFFWEESQEDIHQLKKYQQLDSSPLLRECK